MALESLGQFLRTLAFCIAHRGVRYNKTKESFGVAQREQPTLYKIVRQPLTDPNFVSICENTSSTAVLAHIRAASPGTAITGWNAHPFQFGCHVFMHNGDLAFFDKIKRPLCDEISADAFDVITGTTDSEHLAALMFTYLERLTNVPKAWEGKVAIEDLRISLEQAVAKVIELQVSVSTPDTFQASNVNVCVTDGHQLLAIRFRNHPKEHPPSLYTSVSAGPDLNRKFVGNPDSDGPRPKKFKTILGPHELKPRSEYGPHFVICSEPTTFRKEDWALVPKNTGVIVPPNMKPEWFSIEL